MPSSAWKKKITCNNNTIEEYDKKLPSDLTAEQILIRSGNIGSIRIAQKVGIDNFEDFLTKKLTVIEGVSSVETSIPLRRVKSEYSRVE